MIFTADDTMFNLDCDSYYIDAYCESKTTCDISIYQQFKFC